MTEIQHSDFVECPECGGSGEVCTEDPMEPKTCIFLKDTCKNRSLCPDCKGHKRIATETIDLKVPDGFAVYLSDTTYAIYKKGLYGRRLNEIPLPYKVGNKKTFVCEVCSGTKRLCMGKGEVCQKHTLSCRGCQFYYNDLCNACYCKGKPEIKAEVISLKIEDNKLIIQWGECDG